jgi:hypothetical protein
MENNVTPVIPPEQPMSAPQVPMPSGNQPASDKKSLGTTLCIISLALKLGMPFIGGLITGLTSSGDIGGVNETVGTIASLMTGAGYIAAWVLVIVARVKCKDTFSKVLLIIYLVLLGLEILAVVLFVVMCFSIMSSCNF